MTAITIGDVRATGTYCETDIPPWHEDWGWEVPKYKIVLRRNGRRATFDFWGSHHDYLMGKTTLSPAKLASAVECIADDAMRGHDDLCDIMADLGYDDCKEARRVLVACKQSAAKLSRLGIDGASLYALGDGARALAGGD